jgi:hypothetical protein
MRLSQVCSKDCPVAVLKSKTMKQATNGSCHLKDDSTPNSSILCKGSLVSICGHNFEPKWGLHNGALAKKLSLQKENHPFMVIFHYMLSLI